MFTCRIFRLELYNIGKPYNGKNIDKIFNGKMGFTKCRFFFFSFSFCLCYHHLQNFKQRNLCTV